MTAKMFVFVVMLVEIGERGLLSGGRFGVDVSVGNPRVTRTNASVTSGLLRCRCRRYIIEYTWFFVKKTKMIRKSHEKWSRSNLYSRIGSSRRNKLLQFSRRPCNRKTLNPYKNKTSTRIPPVTRFTGGCFSRKISPNRRHRKTYRTTTIQQKRQ